MKITYDFNNKEEREEIENFFFLKYYIKSFCFDWQAEYNSVQIKGIPRSIQSKLLIKFITKVLHNINQPEFLRTINILMDIDIIKKKKITKLKKKHIINHILGAGYLLINMYKWKLYKKYGNE